MGTESSLWQKHKRGGLTPTTVSLSTETYPGPALWQLSYKHLGTVTVNRQQSLELYEDSSYLAEHSGKREPQH